MNIDQQTICRSAALAEGDVCRFDIRYQGEMTPAIVTRYQGMPVAYVNRCTHMGRRLDDQHPGILDASEALLRCSVHGAVFDPSSGECRCGLCHGEKLIPLKIREVGGWVLLKDRRATLLR